MAQVIYLSHGGGPLPLMNDPGHRKMVEFMETLPSRFEKPEAVIVISAHWEEKAATVTGQTSPSLLLDYYGFPPETYEIKYPAAGNPSLAAEIVSLLQLNSIPCALSEERGLDHGSFIPMLLSYPDASIPTIQLSLMKGLDPARHYALGKALRPLLDRNILIIGSGFSFHNMREFIRDGSNPPDEQNDAFQNYLIDSFTADLTSEERYHTVLDWEAAPSARYCHPREEHLVPLFVCAGTMDIPAELIFDDSIMGKRAIALKWES